MRYHGGRESGGLDFSVNLNPLPPPAGVTDALRGCLSEEAARAYPDYEYRDLVEAIRSFYGCDEVVPLNGSSEGLLLAALAAGARRLVVVQPSYGEHRDLAEALGIRYDPLPMDLRESALEFALDPGRLRGACDDPDALIALTNPNNPTGSFLDPREIEELASGCRSWILLDEAYAELSDAYPGIAPPRGERLVVLRSLTKWLSVPGLRIGFATAPRGLARRMDALRSTWNVNSVADCFVRRSLTGEGPALLSYITRTREYVSMERSRVSGRLMDLGLAPFRGSANFLLIRSREPVDGPIERLRSRGISVRDARTFEGLDRTFFRAAIRSRADDDALLEALGEVFGAGR